MLATGLLAAAASGVTAYRIAGPYGDGPFGAGYRRLPDPSGRGSTLVYEQRDGARTVRAVVDERTRRMSELRVDTDGDGVFETLAHVETGGGVRVQRDLDADGASDRWDYYLDVSDLARDRIAKVGFSLAGDAVVDAWAFFGADGRIVRVDVSTTRDGVVDRWEHYAGGSLARVETDTDGDGRADTWSTYEDGILQETIRDAGGDGRAGGHGAGDVGGPATGLRGDERP